LDLVLGLQRGSLLAVSGGVVLKTRSHGEAGGEELRVRKNAKSQRVKIGNVKWENRHSDCHRGEARG
jgi:hypothetical protein